MFASGPIVTVLVSSLLLAVCAVQGSAAHGQSAVDVLADAAFAAGERLADRHRSLLASPASSAVEVITTFGTLTGVTDGTVTQFLGVPFAAPPVGDLRWAPPMPPAPWGSRNATWWGKACPQNSLNAYWGLFAGMGEDCLTLNVYFPANKTAPAGGWPVMVWYYGGGFAFGSDSIPLLYDGYTVLTSGAADDVMIVTVNYRVATIGFLGGDALQATSPDGSTGNWGLQDQKQGLRFAKDVVIPAMGGNPNRITIYGESAGGASISFFLTNPDGWGLFQQAIIESGSPAAWMVKTTSFAEKMCTTVAAQVGCSNSSSTPSALVACLRRLPWEAFTALEHGSMDPNFGPVIDGVAVPMDPRTAAAKGILAPNVAVLLGANHDEGTSFSAQFPFNLSRTGYAAVLNLSFGPKWGPVALADFPPSYAFGGGTPWGALARLTGDVIMFCPTLVMAGHLTARLNATKVFTYVYDHVNSFLNIVSPKFGVRHASELINVWNLFPDLMQTGPGEKQLAREFIRYWTRFATAGDPNGGSDPVWPLYGAVGINGTVLRLNISAAGVPTGIQQQAVRYAECQFVVDHPPVPVPV